MANGVNAKAQEVINDYSPERRHAIDKIQEKAEPTVMFCIFEKHLMDWRKCKNPL